MKATRPQPHALAKAAAEYRAEAVDRSHAKVSISLPVELLAQVRQAAAESGVSISGVIAAALRYSLRSMEQERLDRALALDAEDNAVWANEALAYAARAWAEVEW